MRSPPGPRATKLIAASRGRATAQAPSAIETSSSRAVSRLRIFMVGSSMTADSERGRIERVPEVVHAPSLGVAGRCVAGEVVEGVALEGRLPRPVGAGEDGEVGRGEQAGEERL